jgi:hypothetical protein
MSNIPTDPNDPLNASLAAGLGKTLTDSKLVTFVVGQQKKSRFQKAREEKELKQKLDDEATAKVLDSFVSSFTEDSESKTFVRGGLSTKGGHDPAIYGGSRGEVYKLESRPRGMSSDLGNNLDTGGTNCSATNTLSSSSSSNSQQVPKGKRQIDDFLNEIKGRQEARESTFTDNVSNRDNRSNNNSSSVARDSMGYNFPPEKGSFDTGDPHTTNLYLGNLSPCTTGTYCVLVAVTVGCILYVCGCVARDHVAGV